MSSVWRVKDLRYPYWVRGDYALRWKNKQLRLLNDKASLLYDSINSLAYDA